jgi:hypothetical protein
MRRLLNTSLVGTLLLVCPLSVHLLVGGPSAAGGLEKPPMARYYITTKVMLATPQVLSVFGASNLPAGSVLVVYISDYIGEGSRLLNDETRAVVGEDGLFEAEIRVKEGLKFSTNMVCLVSFAPTYPPQPEGVIRVVGARGENLGSGGTNPQIQSNSRVTMLVDYTVVRE